MIAACLLISTLLARVGQSVITRADYFYRKDRPMLIAHRGMWGYYPEHTLGAYVEAYYAGVDFLEMDIQLSRDGVPLVVHDIVMEYSTNIMDLQKQYRERRYMGHFYFKDFTLREIKQLYAKQRFARRSPHMNQDFRIQTLQEVIDLVRMLNRDFPRVNNAERRVGIYVEIKDADYYERSGRADPATEIYKVLKANGLDTIDRCKNDIPTVIQSFDLYSLEDWAERFSQSDLPRVFCFGTYGGNVFQTMWESMKDHIFNVYTRERRGVPDWKELALLVNGISPDLQHVAKAGSTLDPMVDDWDKTTVTDNYSDFTALMHSFDLAVHPFPIAEDLERCHFNRTGDAITSLHIFGGSDGVFGEFLDTTYRVLNSGLGNRSLLNFEEHPEREFTLDWYDFNADARQVCLAKPLECMPTQDVFACNYF